MSTKIISSCAVMLLAIAGNAPLAGTASATQSTPIIASGSAGGGHEEVEALKAELASLQTKLNNTETGRQFLKSRLEEVLAEAKAGKEAASALQMENTDLLKSLRFMTDNRDYLVDEMSRSQEQSASAVAEAMAEREALQTAVERAKKGRSFLSESYQKSRGKLVAARAENEELKVANAELEASLAEANKQIAMSTEKSGQAEAEAMAMQEDLQAAVERARKGTSYMTASYKTTRAQLMAARTEVNSLKGNNAELQASLSEANKQIAMSTEKSGLAEAEAMAMQADLQAAVERARKGRSYMTASYKTTRSQLMAARAEVNALKGNNAELQASLEKAKKGRKYLSAQYLKSQASLKQLQADSANSTADATAETDRLTLALERSLQGREFLSSRVRKLEAELKQKDAEMDELAEVSFAQIDSAIAERDAAIELGNNTDWADGLSAELTESFGAQSGTEVTALANNRVAIKVGNTGLFRPGSTILSDGGKALLNEIGQELISRDKTYVSVIGHTDNVPTGSGSNFSSNDELSLVRATSALSYLSSVGVPADRLAASGVGDAYPIASNDTKEGRLANRRVEIVLTPVE